LFGVAKVVIFLLITKFVDRNFTFILKKGDASHRTTHKLLGQSLPTSYPDPENTATLREYLPAVLHYVSAKNVVTVWRFVFDESWHFMK